MKIKEGLELSVLEKYGFTKIDKEEADKECNYTKAVCEYEYLIDYSRRGQYYSIFVFIDGSLSLFASEADGSGGSVAFPNIVFDLIRDNIVEQ